MMWRRGKSGAGSAVFVRELTPNRALSPPRKSELVFEELFTAAPHVFINKDHPLADRKCITLDELKPYPYLIFEQGDRNSSEKSEELRSPCSKIRYG